MPNNFTIRITCKKYVKTYLETNCGIPVNLQLLPDLLQVFTICLDKKPGHRESAEVFKYTESVTVIIPPDVFYRCGWEVNIENILDFNRKVEHNVKFFMRQYISLNHSLGVSIAVCIKEFQERFDFPDPEWACARIKEDFYRNGKTSRITITNLKKEWHTNVLDAWYC